jgi:predicted transcriptional regulator
MTYETGAEGVIERVNPEATMRMATEIVVAYLAQRAVEPEQLPALIHDVLTALNGWPVHLPARFKDENVSAPETEPPTSPPARLRVLGASSPASREPAVPIETSVTDDYIISLEDGRRYRSLKRHLMARHGMTPNDYRAKWGLPNDYPMVAPSYARQRSDVAKRSGLGHAIPKSAKRQTVHT